MKNEKRERLLATMKKRISAKSIFALYGTACALVFTYLLFYLAGLEEFGAYSMLEEQVAAIAEHAVMIGLLGLCGGLLVDLLKKEEAAKEK